MKLTISLLVVLAVGALCASASAAVVTQSDTIYTHFDGWNFVCVTGVPLNPSPASVFADYPRYPEGMDGIEMNLYRWDGATANQYEYNDVTVNAFGGVLLGQGYWVRGMSNLTPFSYSYSALNDTDDMDIWISLPRAGLHEIGNPFSYNFPWNKVKVTDGNETVSLEVAAYEKEWIWADAYAWDAVTYNQKSIGLDEASDRTYLQAKQGCSLFSRVDKIALILEAQPH